MPKLRNGSKGNSNPDSLISWGKDAQLQYKGIRHITPGCNGIAIDSCALLLLMSSILQVVAASTSLRQYREGPSYCSAICEERQPLDPRDLKAEADLYKVLLASLC